MAYNFEEEEQLEAFKAFWGKYGNTILTVVTVVLLAIAGWRGWAWYQNDRSARAAVVYAQLRTAAETNDATRVAAAAQALQDDFSGTAYARMGSLLAAQAQSADDDQQDALANLRWIVDKGGDEIFVLVARLRLAALLIDTQAWDEAERALAGEVPTAFAGLFADRRGDLAIARGQADAARAAYSDALAKLGPASALTRLVQLKLDSLGTGS